MSQSPAFFIGCISPNFSAAPSAAQISCGPGAIFYDMAASPRVYYAISADLASFAPFGSTGGGGVPADTPPQKLGTAATGTSTKYMRQDAILPLPNSFDVGALGIASLSYDPTTNTPALTAGAAPSTGVNYKVINSPYPGTASSLNPAAFSTLVNGDILYSDANNNFQKVDNVPVPRRAGNYTASASYSTPTTESGALMTLQLGALQAGSRVQLLLGEYGNNNGGTAITKVYLNGTLIYTSAANGFFTDFEFLLDFAVLTTTSIKGIARGAGSASTANSDKVSATPAINASVNTITVTQTLSAAGPVTGITYADAIVYY